VQQNLLDLGLEAEIINYDQATYFSQMMDASLYEICIFNPAAPSMLAVDVLAMYLTFIPLGWEGPEHDEYVALAQDAITTADPSERSEKLYKAIQYFVEQCPWYGLCEVVGTRAVSPDLGGIKDRGYIYFQDLYWK